MIALAAVLRRSTVLAPAVVLLLATAACAGSTSAGGGTVTVTVPPKAAGTTASSAAPSATATSSAGATPSPLATRLPGPCASTLPQYAVENALGGTVRIAGSTAFVVGVPDTAIGRLSTINCRYGLTGTGATATPSVEIGVSLYGTAAQAAARVTATRDDYTAHGARVADVAIPAAGGTTLTGSWVTGGRGEGYDLPLLVVASDRRTVAVGVDPARLTSPPAQQAAVELATLALERTAA